MGGTAALKHQSKKKWQAGAERSLTTSSQKERGKLMGRCEKIEGASSTKTKTHTVSGNRKAQEKTALVNTSRSLTVGLELQEGNQGKTRPRLPWGKGKIGAHKHGGQFTEKVGKRENPRHTLDGRKIVEISLREEAVRE